MPLFRRKAPPNPLLANFTRVAEVIDIAQRSLLTAVPTSRDPGIPLAEAIAAFEAALAEADELMPVWRTPETAEAHQRCMAALRHAREEAGRLRLERDTLGFEALNVRIGDVLHPLEEFADAERELKRA